MQQSKRKNSLLYLFLILLICSSCSLEKRLDNKQRRAERKIEKLTIKYPQLLRRDTVKDTFNIDNVVIHPPNSGPNKKPNTHSSSKFNMFEFEVDGKKHLFILSGGASANVGQQFEDKITSGLQDAMEGIEDEQIKQILSKLRYYCFFFCII